MKINNSEFTLAVYILIIAIQTKISSSRDFTSLFKLIWLKGYIILFSLQKQIKLQKNQNHVECEISQKIFKDFYRGF